MSRFYLPFLLLLPFAHLTAQMTPSATFPGLVNPLEYALIGYEEQVIHPAELGLLESYMEAMPVAGVAVIIKENSAADGILACSDIITAVNGHRVSNWYDLRLALDGTRRGLPIPVRVWRNDAEMELELTVPVPVPKSYPETRRVSGKTDLAPGIIRGRPVVATIFNCYGWTLRNFGDSEKGGVLVVSVKPLSAGANAGFQVGDMIVASGDKEITMRYEMDFMLRNAAAAEVLNFTVLRNGELLPLRLVKIECEPEALTTNSRIGTLPASPEFSPAPPPAFSCLQNSNETPAESANNEDASGENNFEPLNFRVFPNPTDGHVTVQFEADPLPFELSVFDSAGKMLFTENIDEFDGHFMREFSFSATGTVFFRMVQNGRVFAKTVLIQR